MFDDEEPDPGVAASGVVVELDDDETGVVEVELADVPTGVLELKAKRIERRRTCGAERESRGASMSSVLASIGGTCFFNSFCIRCQKKTHNISK